MYLTRTQIIDVLLIGWAVPYGWIVTELSAQVYLKIVCIYIMNRYSQLSLAIDRVAVQ
jgi:hypothetical protein